MVKRKIVARASFYIFVLTILFQFNKKMAFLSVLWFLNLTSKMPFLSSFLLNRKIWPKTKL